MTYKTKATKVNPYAEGGALNTVLDIAGTASPLLGAGISLAKGIFGIVADKKAAEAQEKLDMQETLNRKQGQLSQYTSSGGKMYGPGGVEVNPQSLNIGALGGPTSNGRMFDPESNLEEITQGGTHEQNPAGGTQIGVGANGKPNMLEEGETKVVINGQEFVFSARILFTNKGEFPAFMKDSTYAEVSKVLEKAFEDRYDKYSKDTLKAFLERLAIKQETVKELQENPGLKEDNINQNQFPGGGFTDWMKSTASEIEGYQNQDVDNSIYGEFNLDEHRFPGIENIFNMPNTPLDSKGMLEQQLNEIGAYNTPNIDKGYFGLGAEAGANNNNTGKDSWFNDDNISKAALGLGALGQLTGVFSSIRGRNQLRKPEQLNANLLDTSSITENLVNRQSILREVARTQQSAIGALGARASGNFGAYAANVAGIHGKTAEATSGAMLQASELDSREKARVQQLRLGAQQFNVQSQNQTDLANEQNMAAYEAQRGAYTQGIAANLGSMGQSFMNYSIGSQTGKYAGLGEQLKALINTR